MARFYTKKQFYTKLTPRQREFLTALVDIYKNTNAPVSYRDVAEKMGVSKWTAYDLIQELHKKGFLKIEYHLRPGPGRSEVRFIPKDVAIEMLGEKTKKHTADMISEWVKEHLKKYEKMEVAKAISLVSRKVEKEKHPLSVVLYTAVLFILFTKVFSIHIEDFVNLKKVVSSNVQAPVLLSFLTELMFTLSEREEDVLKELNLKDYTIQKFRVLQQKFRENLLLITPGEQKMVLNVIKEMI